MNFYPRRRRKPEVIIVSLIDIFAILLIFVIVTTTFKRAQPAVTIKPAGIEIRRGGGEGRGGAAHLDFRKRGDLHRRWKRSPRGPAAAIAANAKEARPPKLALAVDKKAGFGMVIAVLDVLKQAGVKGDLSAFTEKAK